MGDQKRPPRGKRLLTEEDVALWSHVARSLEPVRLKSRVHRAAERDEEEPPLPPSRSAQSAPPPDVRRTSAQAPRPVPVRPSPPAKAPEPATLPKKQVRKIAKGHVEIDARIDLHGLYQDEAYGALRRFLHRCYASGHRNVLVITGKGAPEGGQARARPWGDDAGGRERGVLKRNVPRWLSEPELAQIVVSHTQAHARHGGEGALYIVLRNARKLRN